MGRAGHLHVIRQMEAAFERAGRDATMQIGLIRIFISFARRDDQRFFTDFNAQVAFGKAGDGDADTIRIIVQFFDIVRG